MGDLNIDQQTQNELSQDEQQATTSDNTSSLLADTFSYYKSKLSVRVELYKDCLKLFNLKAERKNENINGVPNLVISLNDICGSRVGKGHQKNDQKSYLTIYAYVRNMTPSSSNKIRQRKRLTLELTFSKYQAYEENLAHISNWHNQINTQAKRLLYEKYLTTLEAPSSTDSFDNEHLKLAFENIFKPFLVLVNPKSGSGKAKNIYYERVMPVWAESNQENKIVFTRNIKIFW
jgi:hypothetical protein